MSNTFDFWKEIWDKKGGSESEDLLFLDGYDHLDISFDSEIISQKILNSCNVAESDAILEVGCGAGFLAREMQDYTYCGVDYSESIVQKHKKIFPDHDVTVSHSNRLQLPDSSYDIVFCYGLFQYLPGDEYAEETLCEMLRVSKRCVFLGDLKEQKTREEHFVYRKERLIEKGFKILESFGYSECYRYNAILMKEG
jgi:ubiquinone/menaquinone biosynthesis C-methylase UbiE